MTKDDIMRMAREAGLHSAVLLRMYDDREAALCDSEIAELRKIERFANLIVANINPKSFMSWQEGYEAGMEAAAVICDNIASKYQSEHNASSENIADECAGTIRARGTT